MIREYKCNKCQITFRKGVPENFIKTSMPKCPNCGAIGIEETKNSRSIASKKEK